MTGFSLFTESLTTLPGLATWARSFFANRFDFLATKVYADWLDENGHDDAATFFRALEMFKNPARERGPWNGRLVHQFYNVLGYFNRLNLEVNKQSGAWFYIDFDEHYRQMARPIIPPGRTAWRLSLLNGKWSVYRNESDERVSVVSNKHTPNARADQYYPPVTVAAKDFKNISVNDVPDNVILKGFYDVIEAQVRGSH